MCEWAHLIANVSCVENYMCKRHVWQTTCVAHHMCRKPNHVRRAPAQDPELNIGPEDNIVVRRSCLSVVHACAMLMCVCCMCNAYVRVLHAMSDMSQVDPACASSQGASRPRGTGSVGPGAQGQ